jgi:hypothetical protein
MTIKTSLKSGGRRANHNETLVRDANAANLKVKTSVRAGTSFAFQKVKVGYAP